jgi:light-independent protochlorophyllide reductase subunit B
MGLEEHLLHMFRDDFEFHDAAGPSHHGGHAPRATGAGQEPGAGAAQAAAAEGGSMPPEAAAPAPADAGGAPADAAAPVSSFSIVWLPAAENELKKIPFFVRGKARRNTEKYAAERGVSEISVDTLYEAKAHYAR